MQSGTPFGSSVLMPCRALEAFRLIASIREPVDFLGLNALSGIGGVQTEWADGRPTGRTMGLNALSGIGGVQTEIQLLQTARRLGS